MAHVKQNLGNQTLVQMHVMHILPAPKPSETSNETTANDVPSRYRFINIYALQTVTVSLWPVLAKSC